MTNDQAAAYTLLRYRCAYIARQCGFPDITDALHGKWMQAICYGKTDYTLQAHRLSYKSSCLSVAVAIWLVMHPTENALLVRKTDEDVKESIAQVKKVLRHPYFMRVVHMLYGTTLCLTSQTTTELSTNVYTSPRGAAQLVGMGIYGSMTGKHAQWIVADDIINVKDRQSSLERERTKAAIQEFRNLITREGRIVMIGTPWHIDDGFSIVHPPERYTCYETNLISPTQLASIRKSMSPSLFAANYELVHIASENALFATAPTFFGDDVPLYGAIAHIDAAYGGNDASALTLMRKEGDQYYALGVLHEGHVMDALAQWCTLMQRFRVGTVYCETNADKGFLVKELQSRRLLAQGYAESMNKHVKIASYLRPIWDKIHWHTQTDAPYLQCILDYTECAQRDDAPDSASCLARILYKRRRRSLVQPTP